METTQECFAEGQCQKSLFASKARLNIPVYFSFNDCCDLCMMPLTFKGEGEGGCGEALPIMGSMGGSVRKRHPF